MSPPTPAPTNPPSPLDRLRRRQHMLWLVAAPLLIACACWTLAPLPTVTTADGLPEPIDSSQAQIGAEPPPSIDPTVFAVNLWNPPPGPQSVDTALSEPAPPAVPLNIQLVGIVTESVDGRAIQKAALYDADNDRMILVADGERLRDHTVRVLAGGVVELSDGRSTRRLQLRIDKEAS